ncbi:63 kDa sperm flagellar membrane protein [Elysia marginata]|uniref:63 kDa sperm flagellar membrane protein n=1 Tax=Elysia marginata TaxID=1093978 RepID=A0AAV4JH35_9GAST|nr:63 kDa sperm flagellar membrane protein [Elysia marginata]
MRGREGYLKSRDNFARQKRENDMELKPFQENSREQRTQSSLPTWTSKWPPYRKDAVVEIVGFPRWRRSQYRKDAAVEIVGSPRLRRSARRMLRTSLPARVPWLEPGDIYIKVTRIGPTRLYDECTFDQQCLRLDTNSSCTGSRCLCSNVTFSDRRNKACLPLPSSIGSACGTDAHCQRKINDSFCHNDVCRCVEGHFMSVDRLWCPRVPSQLGDYCDSGIRCRDYLANTACNDSSCVCRYGYTKKNDTHCEQRSHIQHYDPLTPEVPTFCRKGTCSAWTNSTCIPAGPSGDQQVCACKPRTARQFGTSECIAAQTYVLSMEIAYQADVYDYKPLRLGSSAQERKKFSDLVLLNGVKTLFEKSWLRERYLSSQVQAVSDLGQRRRSRRSPGGPDPGGVTVSLLVHLSADYLDAEKAENILKAVLQQLRSKRSNGTIGTSGLRLRRPFNRYVDVTDFNECKAKNATDCSPLANCINTLGSYMCVCRPDFVDVEDSLDYEVRGKNCTGNQCTVHVCLCEAGRRVSERRVVVVIVLVLFVLTIMVFIVYEIVKRKQSFNARALYAKFGTTKIRKLQKASMRRLKERKKRMKEESKKRREENKTKREKMKKDGASQKTEKNEEKKRKAEEKKKRKQEAAEMKKAKKEEKKAEKKKNKPQQTEDPSKPMIDVPSVIEETSISMPSESAETSVTTPATPYDNLFTTTPATPYDNLFMYYPVASPDPAVAQDWKLQDSQESPV